mmetsp:Transcript_25523/g.59433  ORF Transcript_25523/g.59433 Transcript_25523/m.59433 type:complete len:475 (+) Transcript_25523:286-1710(+)
MATLMKQKSFRRRITLDLESVEDSPHRSPARCTAADRLPHALSISTPSGMSMTSTKRSSSRAGSHSRHRMGAEMGTASDPLPASWETRCRTPTQLPAVVPPTRGHRRHHHHRLHSLPTEQELGKMAGRARPLPFTFDTSLPVSQGSGRPRSKTWATDPSAELTTPSTCGSDSRVTSCSCTPTSESSVMMRRQTPIPSVQGSLWRRGDKIGSGSYGSVYKALAMDTGLIFAVKQAVIQDTNEEDRKFKDQLVQEIDICKDLRHPNIVSYLGHECKDDGLYIFLEYAPGGSLAAMYKEFGPLQSNLLPSTTKGLVQGLNYLHTLPTPIIHRDIKCANVLVDLNFCVKLADFGCSKRDTLTTSFTTLGSIPWMAPEVIQQENGYGRKADIWSLGCTVLEMATAEKPWGDRAFDNVMYAMRHIGMSDATPPIPKELDSVGQSFISGCVQRCATNRPRTQDLLRHEFIRTISTAVPAFG